MVQGFLSYNNDALSTFGYELPPGRSFWLGCARIGAAPLVLTAFFVPLRLKGVTPPEASNENEEKNEENEKRQKEETFGLPQGARP